MRYTLLSVVKKCLVAMSSDDINSLTGSDVTEEALTVASLAEDLYHSFVDEYQLPSNHRLLKLGSGGVGKPNYLKLPDRVKVVTSIRYNKRLDTDTKDVYNDVVYITPEEFLHLSTSRDSSASNVETITDPVTGVPVYILNDVPPSYWTSFDDKYICFDSYDGSVDAELQVSKTMCMAETHDSWSLADDYVIPIPDHLTSLYLNELKSICFSTIKQVDNMKAEQAARRLRFNVQSQKNRTDIKPKRPDYGRKR